MKMTILEAFDKAATGLVAQGKRSTMMVPHPEGASKEAERCAYRGADGAKCGVGFLIEDDEYSPAIENFRFAELINSRHNAFYKTIPVLQIEMMRQLQALHDTFDPSEWQLRLADMRVSVEHGKYGDPSSEFVKIERTGVSKC